MAVPPHFCDSCTMCKLYQLTFKKGQMILMSGKYNHKSTKAIDLLPSREFSDFSKFQHIFVKSEKNR